MNPQKVQGQSLVNAINQIVSFECPICIEDYDDKIRYPMIICPLQHCICRKCAQTLIFVKEDENKCPECRNPIYKDKMVQFRYLSLIKKVATQYKQKGNTLKPSMLNDESEQKMQQIQEKQIQYKRLLQKQRKLKERQLKNVKNQLQQQLQLIQKLKIQNKRLQQQKQKQKQKQLQQKSKQWKCLNGHNLKQVQHLPYRSNKFKCDGCGVYGTASKQNQVQHCYQCRFDVCKQCYEGKNVRSQLKCSKQHTLIVISQVPYIFNRFRCNRCGASKYASQVDQVWHCNACRYDLCSDCAEASKVMQSKIQRKAQGQAQRQQQQIKMCPKKHILIAKQSLSFPYLFNRYVCNVCKAFKAASKENIDWQCYQCRYDVCEKCLK